MDIFHLHIYNNYVFTTVAASSVHANVSQLDSISCSLDICPAHVQ